MRLSPLQRLPHPVGQAHAPYGVPSTGHACTGFDESKCHLKTQTLQLDTVLAVPINEG